jgi:phosphatidylglycerophosphate synthase
MIGLIAAVALLAALAATVGLSGSGWVVGITCAVVTNAALARGMTRCAADGLGPADRVTLTRATLVGGVAALSADWFGQHPPVTTLVTLVVIALVLDAVDGWVARRTKTASTLGARFDMEVDAFLIFVLSMYVAREVGWWVLTIGAARYAFVAAGWLLAWMRGSLPPRYWRKVVAAIQGVVLTFAVADVAPRPLTDAALAVALALLAESFGRDVWWLWRGIPGEPRWGRTRMRTGGSPRPPRMAGGANGAGSVSVRDGLVGGTRIVILHALSQATDSATADSATAEQPCRARAGR